MLTISFIFYGHTVYILPATFFFMIKLQSQLPDINCAQSYMYVQLIKGISNYNCE